MNIRPLRAVNLGISFLLELALVAAIAYWGLCLDSSAAIRWLAAVGASAALVLTWGVVAAPTAKRRLPRRRLIGFKLLVFTIGAGLFYSTGTHDFAIALEAAAVANLALAVLWDQV